MTSQTGLNNFSSRKHAANNRLATRFLYILLVLTMFLCLLPTAAGAEGAFSVVIDSGEPQKVENFAEVMTKANAAAATAVITVNADYAMAEQAKFENSGVTFTLKGASATTKLTRAKDENGDTTFKACMVYVVSGALNIEDITIDGESSSPIEVSEMINVGQGATLNVKTGATLKNNNRQYSSGDIVQGGAICSQGNVNISGGTITGNSIEHGAAAVGAGVFIYPNGSLTISGAPVISGNKVKIGSNAETVSNVYVSRDKPITVSALVEGADIGVTTQVKPLLPDQAKVVFANGGTGGSGNSEYFKSDEGYTVEYNSDNGNYKLLAHSIEVEFGKTDIRRFASFETGWNAAVGSDNTEKAKVKLLGNWTATGGSFGTGDGFGHTVEGTRTDNGNILIPAGKTITLDLNGKTIDRALTGYVGKGHVIQVSGSLTLEDSADKGIIKGGYSGDGGGVFIDNNATFEMKGGTISGNKADFNGGGVYNENMFIMSGGKITGNTAGLGTDKDYIYGGGVFLKEAGIIEVSGTANISGNHSANNNSAPTLDNVYLTDGKTITISGALTGDAFIGVTTKTTPTEGTPVAITAEYSADYSANFTSDSDGFEAAYNKNTKQVELQVAQAPSATVSDVNVDGAVNYDAQPRDLTITLKSDKFVASLLDEADVTGWFSNAPTGLAATVTEIKDSKAAYITISGKPTAAIADAISITIPAGMLASNADLVVTANDDAKWNIVTECAATVKFSGGEVYGYGSAAEAWNAAVSQNETAFTLLKDWIGDDSGSLGTGVGFGEGVSGNNTGYILVPGNEVTIDLHGHMINRNLKTAKNDGLVINVGGDLTVKDSKSGGKITGGNSLDNGGGVFILAGDPTPASFVLESGEISGNKAYAGGGVFAIGTFEMKGGKVINNSASNANSGGGVAFNKPTVGEGILKVSGVVEITGNTADGAANNVGMVKDQYLDATELSAGSKIGISTFDPPTAEAPIVISTDNDNDITGCFTSDNDAYIIENSADDQNKVLLALKDPYKLKNTDTRYLTMKGALDGATESKTIQVLYDNSSIGGEVSIAASSTLESDVENTARKIIAKSGDSITVAGDKTLTLRDVILTGAGDGEYDLNVGDGNLAMAGKSQVGKIQLGDGDIDVEEFASTAGVSTIYLTDYEKDKQILTNTDAVKNQRFALDNPAYKIGVNGKLEPSDKAKVEVTGGGKTKYYDTLEAAALAAKSGGKITLLKDVKLAADTAIKDGVTLDIGAFTLTNSGVLTNSGTIEVGKDGKLDNKNTVGGGGKFIGGKTQFVDVPLEAEYNGAKYLDIDNAIDIVNKDTSTTPPVIMVLRGSKLQVDGYALNKSLTLESDDGEQVNIDGSNSVLRTNENCTLTLNNIRVLNGTIIVSDGELVLDGETRLDKVTLNNDEKNVITLADGFVNTEADNLGTVTLDTPPTTTGRRVIAENGKTAEGVNFTLSHAGYKIDANGLVAVFKPIEAKDGGKSYETVDKALNNDADAAASLELTQSVTSEGITVNTPPIGATVVTINIGDNKLTLNDLNTINAADIEVKIEKTGGTVNGDGGFYPADKWIGLGDFNAETSDDGADKKSYSYLTANGAIAQAIDNTRVGNTVTILNDSTLRRGTTNRITSSLNLTVGSEGKTLTIDGATPKSTLIQAPFVIDSATASFALNNTILDNGSSASPAVYVEAGTFKMDGASRAGLVKLAHDQKITLETGFTGGGITKISLAKKSDYAVGTRVLTGVSGEQYTQFMMDDEAWPITSDGTLGVPKPEFSPVAGTYQSAQTVTLTTSAENATIYYTIDGTDPSESSKPYTAPISVSTTTTIRAIAKTAAAGSEIASATYTISVPVPPTPTVVATPVISPNGGSFETAQTVTLTCATQSATIRYTVDGTDPTETSAEYTQSITVSQSCTVKAKGFKLGMTESAVASAVFIIETPVPPTPTKPYVEHADGTKTEYDTVQEALNNAISGERVVVPVLIEFTGDLIVPAGVTLIINNKVYTKPENDGKLIVHKDGTLTTMAGEHVFIRPLTAGKETKADEISAYFISIEVSGVYTNGGTLDLTDAKTTGDGVIEVVATGEVTLNGESTLGKVKLYPGRTVTLGKTFSAASNAATLILGDDYELNRKVLTFLSEDQGKFAKYFKLGDAPDDSWYIGEDGLLTCKPDPKESYLLLDKLALSNGKRVTAKNLLPLKFKGGATFASSDTAILKIAGKGQKKFLKPLKLGIANLTVTFSDGKSQTIPVTVLRKKEGATSLTLKKKLTMNIGASKTPKATVKPLSALDKTLKWFTTDKNIAAVTDKGVITAVNKGKCKVYALTTAGVRKIITVTVKK